MSLYKSAQLHTEDDFAEIAEPDEVILYEDKPDMDDVVELHSPENKEGVEISFSLPELPGSDFHGPIEVSTNDEEKESKKKSKKDKDKNDAQLEVHDPWDWKSRGLENFVAWVHERLSNIPKHSGRDTTGIERAIAYLSRVNSEISKAVQTDHDEKIDISLLEQARREIHSGIQRLEQAKKQLNDAYYKAADKDHELIKEAKQTRIGGMVITVPIFIYRLGNVCINAMVSNGKDIERTYDMVVKEYDLSKREQLELLQYMEDCGYAMPRRDRGLPRDSKLVPTSTDNPELMANYSA